MNRQGKAIESCTTVHWSPRESRELDTAGIGGFVSDTWGLKMVEELKEKSRIDMFVVKMQDPKFNAYV